MQRQDTLAGAFCVRIFTSLRIGKEPSSNFSSNTRHRSLSGITVTDPSNGIISILTSQAPGTRENRNHRLGLVPPPLSRWRRLRGTPCRNPQHPTPLCTAGRQCWSPGIISSTSSSVSFSASISCEISLTTSTVCSWISVPVRQRLWLCRGSLVLHDSLRSTATTIGSALMCVTTNKKLSPRYFSAQHLEFWEIIHVRLLEPSFGHRESESVVVEKRVDLGSRLCGR